MPDTNALNYPDVLGYITGGPRLNAGVTQLALAVRPRVVRAGHPFEAILLIQNASDVAVDLIATLQMPELDARRQRRRFVSKTERLVVGLRAAEVGYVSLPLACLPDTAVGDGYKLGMAVEAKPVSKPRRVRLPEGGAPFAVEHVSDEIQAHLLELKRLTFSVARRGLIGMIIEAPFVVMGSQVGAIPDFKPGWHSLWTMLDYYRDERLLLERHSDVLLTRVLPLLKRHKLFTPILNAVQRRIGGAGYALRPVEALYIAKLLVTVLEMASPTAEAYDHPNDDQLNVALLLKKRGGVPQADGSIALPSWCRAFLRALERDEHAADRPIQMLVGPLFDELLRDAVRLAFRAIIAVTGADLGTEDDMREYSERLISLIVKPSQPLTFSDVYLPLVIGGIIFADRVIAPDERVGDRLVEMETVLQERADERSEDNELVFELAERVLDQALQKYGYRP